VPTNVGFDERLERREEGNGKDNEENGGHRGDPFNEAGIACLK